MAKHRLTIEAEADTPEAARAALSPVFDAVQQFLSGRQKRMFTADGRVLTIHPRITLGYWGSVGPSDSSTADQLRDLRDALDQIIADHTEAGDSIGDRDEDEDNLDTITTEE